MKQFIYCESEEGGMNSFLISESLSLQCLYGWMDEECAEDDQKLVTWMAKAQVGEVYYHRLGVIVRLKDVGKIHLRDTTAKPSDYPNSPHILTGIANGKFTACKMLTDRITDNILDVTCKACLRSEDV